MGPRLVSAEDSETTFDKSVTIPALQWGRAWLARKTRKSRKTWRRVSFRFNGAALG